MSTTTVYPPNTATTLETALQQLVQQGQQNNQLLQSLASELQVMNRQLFHERAGTLMAPYPQPTHVNGQTNGFVAGTQEEWRKTLQTSTCAEIGVSKTRSLNKWKLLFFMYGVKKPAAVYSADFADLIRLVAEVWPEISDGHFSEETFNQRNKEVRDKNPDFTYVARYSVAPFNCTWYDGPPTEMSDGRKMTFRYCEQVHPCDPVV